MISHRSGARPASATSGCAVSIGAGCNGIEAAIVLTAGVVALPESVKQKIIAILAGFLFEQAQNIVRIIPLFYARQWNYTVFKWFRLCLWTALTMLDVLVVLAMCLQWLVPATARVDIRRVRLGRSPHI